MVSQGLRGGNKQGGMVAVTVWLTGVVYDVEKMEVVGLLWQSVIMGRRSVE